MNFQLQKMTNPDNIKLVVGIDFGTTYSAYAYSYEYEQDNIFINNSWPSGVQTYKEATAILFDKNCKFVAFGEEAIDQYTDLTDKKEEKKCYFFNCFKMALHKEKSANNVNRNLMLKAANGETMSGLEVFSAAINFLKEHFIENVNNRNVGNDITVESVRWVLTVPAIWSDSAKQFMRESAEKAGIPRKNLVIALEPECASFYCQNLPAEKLGGLQTVDFKKVGSKFMVLDNGGGTIDVTVHQILEGGCIRELYKATGGAWGGTKVDEAFISYFCEIFSEKVIETLRRKYPSDLVDMMRDFEKTKRKINLDDQKKFVRMRLNSCVRNKVKGSNLNKVFKKDIAGTRGAILNHSKLEIPRTVISEMIEQVAKNISSHTSFLMKLKENENLDFIFMVGGFSNSPIVVKEIRDLVSPLPVIVPENAELSVVQGAVMFGWKPDIFKSRMSKRTYGISITANFRENVDPERLILYNDDKVKKCTKRFGKLVSVNEDIEIDQTVTRTYYPMNHNQMAMTIDIYESEESDVSYCDQPGVKKLGTLTVPMKDTTGGRSRQVNVSVRFGGTEFFVTATDETTGAVVLATYDFL